VNLIKSTDKKRLRKFLIHLRSLWRPFNLFGISVSPPSTAYMINLIITNLFLSYPILKALVRSRENLLLLYHRHMDVVCYQTWLSDNETIINFIVCSKFMRLNLRLNNTIEGNVVCKNLYCNRSGAFIFFFIFSICMHYINQDKIKAIGPKIGPFRKERTNGVILSQKSQTTGENSFVRENRKGNDLAYRPIAYAEALR